ncbi:MAG: response regulator [Flavobacteriales bacterium]|nr:response regulator [Flavobacteriales bacterium]MCB9198282.1 response regulator [Flavobacteriales bacterium]
MSRILIIEDNQEIRENTAELLMLAGYSVETAENGKAGVKMAIEIVPDLIICDIMMPELDGYGVRQLLADNIKLKDVPFIFLTAKADKSDFRKGMNMGADDYLTKPFDETDLMNSIKLRLEKASKQIKSGAESLTPKSIQEFVNQVIKDKKKVRFSKRDVIYRESDFALFSYFIVSGKVKTYRINEEGKELIFDIFKENDVIGMWDVLKGAEYSESVSCLEDTELIKIHKDDVHQYISGQVVDAGALIQIFAQELKEREDRLISMAYDSVRMRLATALTVLEDVYKHKEDNTVFKVQREDLAAMVGTSTESVIRTLSDFKKEGLISIKKNEIFIQNSQGLRHLRF